MGPMFLRTLLDAKPRLFGYNIVEYNLVNGSWKLEEVKVGDTLMRIEQDGQQFETYIRDWQLSPKNLWLKDYSTYLAVRQMRNYVGSFPQPVY